MSHWRLAMWLAGGAAYAGLSHWMMLYHAAAPWALAALFAPLWLALVGLAASRFGRLGALATLLLGAFCIYEITRGEAGNPNRLYVMQHVGINIVLCAWFASTLRAGRLSLIGEFAQRIHPLTSDHVTYTAKVTGMWALYFAAMAAASVLTYLTLPFQAWSLLANVLTPLFIVALFLGEHFARYRLHPEFERSRLVDVVRVAMGRGRAQ
ncbi:hypothetical protein QTH91_13865 [Variovorax dokdonensis]|uniref:Transmembrane protein n=1 Tax=Variovorax dokdonensis TaxID=344883 RepID=A0ABT7NCJ9_9BURK|nr:hypothetical protein [Variovorax dokdonensis]MDM0045575.1 hypothetical protein [Variovorax dokdonensis]